MITRALSLLRLPSLAALSLAALAGLAPAQEPAAGDQALLPSNTLQFGDGAEYLRILPTGRLLTIDNIIYTEGRTTVVYGDAQIVADNMAIDIVTQEVRAEGDVEFFRDETEMKCDSLRFSFRLFEGIAYGVDGVDAGYFFRSRRDEDAEGPAFQVINEDGALIEKGSMTWSGFPVSTWYLKADEIYVSFNRRFFMRHPVLYIRSLPDHLGITRDIPIFWLPVFTLRLDQSPWTYSAGILADYGPFLSVGYNYEYTTEVPSWEDETVYVTRSEGRMGLRSDIFLRGAIGVGMDYQYSHDFERHIGSLTIYGIRDTIRDTGDRDSIDVGNDENRYVYRHRHNSLFGKTIWQLNADWMSDPDVYYDVLDRVGTNTLSEREGRKPERRLRAAVTYLERDYLARLSMEIKDRLTLDRYQDFSDPLDDNINFDPDPFQLSDQFILTPNGQPLLDAEGNPLVDVDGTQLRGEGALITEFDPEDRYGRVTQRFEGRVATRLLPFFRTPLFYRNQTNVFRNLDAGFNEFDTEDDTWFTGVDTYSSLTSRLKLDGAGRFTWMNTVGVGVGVYQRDDDSIYGGDGSFNAADYAGFPPGLSPVNEQRVLRVDGLRLLDENRLLVGEGDRELDGADLSGLVAWADYRSRLSARFSDTLSGYLQYTIRETGTDGPGEFYRYSGRQEAFEDVYDFPTSYHWVEALMDYALAYPNLNAYGAAGYNLDGEPATYERLWYLRTGVRYANDTDEFQADANITLDSRQVRDTRDPDQFVQAALSGNLGFRYLPVHQRWWTELRISGRAPLQQDPVNADNRTDARFDEDEPNVSIRPLIGRQFGPKYAAEIFLDYNTEESDIRTAGVTFLRDLYDAEVGLFVGVRNTRTDNNNIDDDLDNNGDLKRDLQPDFRFSVAIKQPRQKAIPGAFGVQTMRDRERRASLVE